MADPGLDDVRPLATALSRRMPHSGERCAGSATGPTTPCRRTKLASCGLLAATEVRLGLGQVLNGVETRVLVINTGGTIGMKLKDEGNS